MDRQSSTKWQLLWVLTLLGSIFEVEADNIQPRSPEPSLTPPGSYPNQYGGEFDTSRSGLKNMGTMDLLTPPKVNLAWNNPAKASYRLNDEDTVDSTALGNSYFGNMVDIPETEQDELLYPQITPRLSPYRSGIQTEVNPQELLTRFGKEHGITANTAMKALGIKDTEEDPGAISPFIELDRSPDTSRPGTPTPRVGYGSPSSNWRYTLMQPDSMTPRGDADEGNVEEDLDEDLGFQLPVSSIHQPSLKSIGPEKVNPVKLTDGTITLTAVSEPGGVFKSDYQSLYQEKSDLEYAQGFPITIVGGAGGGNAKVNAVLDEKGRPVVAIQYEVFNRNWSRWTIKDGTLWLSATDYFAYLCHISGEKVEFRLGHWSEKAKLAKSCTGRAYDNFIYTGWEIIKGKQRGGVVGNDYEIVFNNPKTTSLNKDGLFGGIFPSRAFLDVWVIIPRKDGSELLRYPKYYHLATWPNSGISKLGAGTGQAQEALENKPLRLTLGDVRQTGNKVADGWTVKDIYAGAPIQLQCSVPAGYPQDWFLTEVSPGTDPFNSGRDIDGADVITASLDTAPKPGVWRYDASSERLYKWGTKKFLYTCRDEKLGGAFLRVGTASQAVDQCGGEDRRKDYVHPVRVTFDAAPNFSGRVSVQVGKGLLWVTPDPKWTAPGWAFRENGSPKLARLMTAGPPDYSDMSKKQAEAAMAFREQITIIIEAFVVKIPPGPYIQF
ncbi:hypothetical protein TWF694_009445 [Orbilia ellipsospora]|uniref:Uncharacterized protein n=1 Tax=Orbilia ellipsospora TaxID=2528407 RepID=A0AAV9XBB0_9PEZI